MIMITIMTFTDHQVFIYVLDHFVTLINELIHDIMDFLALCPAAKLMAQSIKYSYLIYFALSVPYLYYKYSVNMPHKSQPKMN